MELNYWTEVPRSALIFGLPILIIGLWAARRRKAQKKNERTSEVLRKKRHDVPLDRRYLAETRRPMLSRVNGCLRAEQAFRNLQRNLNRWT